MLLGLTGLHLDAGDREAALARVQTLLELDPDDPEGFRLQDAARSLPR